MVSVLAIGPKVGEFKPGQCYGFLRAIQFRSTSFCGGEVKLSVLCNKIVIHVKEPFVVLKIYFVR
jgi:hypothetical protein